MHPPLAVRRWIESDDDDDDDEPFMRQDEYEVACQQHQGDSLIFIALNGTPLMQRDYIDKCWC